MGTEITLDISGLALDYSKNHMGNDHGALFQEKDRQRRRSDQVNYEYFIETNADPAPMEMAFAKPLREVLPRLEVMGFTLKNAETAYQGVLQSVREEMAESADDDAEPKELMGFDEFCDFVTIHAVQSLDDTFISSIDGRDESQTQGRFSDKTLTSRIPTPWDVDHWSAYSERSYFGSLIRILHPYYLLRILAGNPENMESEVVWQYGPLVENGWASEDQFKPGARRRQTFLIATEGSSDVHILKHAFSILRPEIADFFRFIDVNERHPFSGAGNLRNFAEGLAKIDIHNQTVFLFDNDAEGVDAFQKVSGLSLPPNMRAMTLPDMDEFRDFPAKGPEGLRRTDINGRAAAIECYLDLEFNGNSSAQVIWTNLKKDLDVYQGALESKEGHTKAFLDQSTGSVASGAYNVNKISRVLDAIVAECTAIAESHCCGNLLS
ncbi:MAG: HEPN/Toprim-associated domain-containing protein [Magnetococcus sp. WYHC-3]